MPLNLRGHIETPQHSLMVLGTRHMGLTDMEEGYQKQKIKNKKCCTIPAISCLIQ
jgi:hypothetical protein